MSSKPKTFHLSQQQAAMRSYLEGLLAEVPDYEPAMEASRPEPAVVRTLRPEPPVPPPAPAAVIPLPKVAAPVPTPVEVTEATPAETTIASTAAAAPRAPDGRPAWAEAPFPCLLFKVDGLSLAVPLVHLNGVLPWPEQITPMPGHRDFFLGLHPHQGNNVKVVDTARVVLPADRRGPEEEGRYSNIVLIDEGRWGLACAAVDEMITIDPARVKWRSVEGKRPWLAGTVIDQMCALLDVDAFAQMLATGERV